VRELPELLESDDPAPRQDPEGVLEVPDGL
jgi:hypothetical protein